MIKTCFNEGWFFGKGSGSALSDLFGGNGSDIAITLPHDAAILEPRDKEDLLGSGNAYFRKENYHYKKKFIPNPEDSGKRFLLLFEGVYQNAFVYVNNSFAAKHPYGYGQFYVDITKFLKWGEENTISVTVKNEAASGRWYTGGGIYRDVFLLVGESLSIAPYGPQLETVEANEELALIRVKTKLDYHGTEVRNVRLKVELQDMEGNLVTSDSIPVTVQEQEKPELLQKLYVKNPYLWDAEHPFLYQYHVKILENGKVIDEADGTFGIRTLSVDPFRGLTVNRKTVNLRGGCIHHDNGIIGGVEFAHAERVRIRELKKAGYNAIRSAHYPISRQLLETCDELGVYVMDEFSDVWTTTKVDFDYGMQFTEWWKDDVTAMVQKDYNHPCVILYSIGNEIPEVGNRFDVQFGKQIADTIRTLDDSRPLVNCMNLMLAVMDRLPKVMEAIGMEENMSAGEINELMTDFGSAMGKITGSDYVSAATEEASSHVDVTGLNYAAVRYELDGKKFPNRVLVGSETNPGDLDVNWPLVEKLPYVIGDFSWTAWDYLGEAGIGLTTYGKQENAGFYAPYPCKAAYCGDFNLIGDRRPTSYWREIIWGLRKKPYLAVQPPQHYGEKKNQTQWAMTDAVRSWNFKGYEKKPVRIEVYSEEEEAELYVNGVCVERKVTGAEKRAITCFDTIYEPGTIEVVVYSKGQETGRDRIQTAEDKVQMVAKSDRERIPADGSDICYIDVWIEDKDGILNMEADPFVTVSLDGPGQIQGFGSAAPVSEENYFDSEAVAFEGRIRAAIRANGTGKICASFHADGLETQTVEIQAE